MLSFSLQKQLGSFYLQTEMTMGSEILAILGLSGSGKSTLLNLLAGLLKPDQGEISLNGQLYFNKNYNLPPYKRKIGYVFQDYALFSHLNVLENITYGANNPYQEISELLRIDRLLDRSISQLSGGQKQRVALARALLYRPELLLLDEPFSALDNLIRTKLRMDLLNVHKHYPIPTILVTHNLEEAFTLGDRIAIMDEGRILQVADPETVFYRPASKAVARFVGMKNFFSGEILQLDKAKNLTLCHSNNLNVYLPYKESHQVGSQIEFGIRPEDIRIVREDRPRTTPIVNPIKTTVWRVIRDGLSYRLFLRIQGSIKNYDMESLIPRHLLNSLAITEGQTLSVHLPVEALHNLDY